MIRIVHIGVCFCELYVTESMFAGIFIQNILKMLFAIKYTAIWSGILYKNDMDFAVILWYNNYLEFNKRWQKLRRMKIKN